MTKNVYNLYVGNGPNFENMVYKKTFETPYEAISECYGETYKGGAAQVICSPESGVGDTEIIFRIYKKNK